MGSATEHASIIDFYNKIFVPSAKEILVSRRVDGTSSLPTPAHHKCGAGAAELHVLTTSQISPGHCLADEGRTGA